MTGSNLVNPAPRRGDRERRSYHHQIVIHRWGWTLVLNPDGTTIAWNPDRTKVLRSHSPPARAG